MFYKNTSYHFIQIAIFITTTVAIYPHFAIVNHPKYRLGNNLENYCKAKWISYKYNIPFLLKPFRYSDQLRLYHFETHLEKEFEKQFDSIILANHENDLFTHTHTSVLYQCNICFQANDIIYFDHLLTYADDHPTFKDILCSMIKPLQQVPSIKLPKNIITIAVHVRKGGGYDKPLYSIQEYDGHQNLITYVNKNVPFIRNKSNITRAMKPYTYSDKRFPFKFPPDQYYIDQIKKLSEILNDVPLYVHIFTDDRNPKAIKTRFEKVVNKPNITFSCREKGNNPYGNVLKDLFSMSKFDCLIRSASTFARIAQLIGNHKIVIYPIERHYSNATWIDNKLIMTKVCIIEKNIES